MSQHDPVKKATFKAYLTSGAIVVLSLLTFFYFHKQDDDAVREQITRLQVQLAESQKEIQTLKSAPPRATAEPAAKPEEKPQTKPLVPPQMTLIEPTTPKGLAPEIEKQEVEVYITRTDSKYHRAGCQDLSRSSIPVSIKEAIRQGYEACSRCKP